MTNNEVITILRRISTAYRLFEINEDVVALWIEALEDMPFETVFNNLNHHIKTNPFAPNVAQIAALEKTQNEFMKKYEDRLAMMHARY